MKILYLDPVVKTTTSKIYKYYDGVYEELEKIAEVRLFQEPVSDFNYCIEKTGFQPDAVVFGLGWFNHKYFGTIRNLNVPSFCILFKPQNDLREKLKFCIQNDVKCILTPIPEYKKYEIATKIRAELFPYGFNPETFKNRDIEKVYDVGFTGALHESKHYPTGAFKSENIRTRVGEVLKASQHLNTFWSSSDKRHSRIPNYDEYARKINSSRIWIATSAALGDITPRY